MTSSFSPITEVTQIRLLTMQAPHRIPMFVRGEILEGLVLRNLRDGRVLLRLGEHTVPAHSMVPLQEGMRVTFRVEDVTPQTTLQLLTNVPEETKTTNHYILLHRTNPQLLADTLTLLKTTITSIRGMESLPGEIGTLLEQVGILLETIVLTPSALTNPEFLRDYVQGLGILLEHGVLRSIEEKSHQDDIRQREGLKGILIRLSRVIEGVINKIDSADLKTIEHLLKLQRQSALAIQAIETQQMLNVVSAEVGDPFILFIPLSFPRGIQLQELYIDRREGGALANIPRRFVLLLDMDNLGEIMVEVKMTGMRFTCRITCQNENGRQAIHDELGDLENRFLAAGLEIDKISCVVDPCLGEKTKDFRSTLTINRRELVSVFV